MGSGLDEELDLTDGAIRRTMMYLFNSLDKANLGNAKTAGLEKDLGFAGTNKWYALRKEPIQGTIC